MLCRNRVKERGQAEIAVILLVALVVLAFGVLSTPSIEVNEYGKLPDVKRAHIVVISPQKEKYGLLNLIKAELEQKGISLTDAQDSNLLIFVYAQPKIFKYTSYKAIRSSGRIGLTPYSGVTYVPVEETGKYLQVGVQILDENDNCLWEAWGKQRTIIAKYKTILTEIMEKFPL